MPWWRPSWAVTPRWPLTSSTPMCLNSWPLERQAGRAWTSSSRSGMIYKPFSLFSDVASTFKAFKQLVFDHYVNYKWTHSWYVSVDQSASGEARRLQHCPEGRQCRKEQSQSADAWWAGLLYLLKATAAKGHVKSLTFTVWLLVSWFVAIWWVVALFGNLGSTLSTDKMTALLSDLEFPSESSRKITFKALHSPQLMKLHCTCSHINVC